VLAQLAPQSRYRSHRPLLFAILCRIGVPATALPLIREELLSADYHLFAGAARAAGMLGPRARFLVPLLLPALRPGFPDHELSDTFGDSYVGITSARKEAIQALAKIGPDTNAIPLLSRIARGDTAFHLFSLRRDGSQEEARRALQAVVIPRTYHQP
jgi:hypothetical protein